MIDDLIKVPLSIGNGRLDIKPNSYNEVYELDGILIHYQLLKEEPILSQFGIVDIRQRLGIIDVREIYPKNIDPALQELECFGICIWDKVPHEFRDVILMHELVELKALNDGNIPEEAHEIAKKETEKYVRDNLSLEEQSLFREYETKIIMRKYSELLGRLEKGFIQTSF